MKRHNLHVHSTWSDGERNPAELALNGFRGGLEVLGICDHAFSRKLHSNYQVTENIGSYWDELRKVGSDHKDCDLKAGLEIDVSLNYGVSPNQLPIDELNLFDYLLFEYVNTEDEYWGRVGSRDIGELVAVREKLVVPVGLAHNDLQANFKGRESEIAKILAGSDIFVELNQSEYNSHRGVGRNTRNGLDYYRYFSPALVEAMRKEGVKVVLGTDSHSGIGLERTKVVEKFVEENGLEYHELVS